MPYTILIIEDETALIDTISDVLETSGYASIRANNGKDGLDIALEEVPDLILCDVMMPGLNGFDVVKAIRSFSYLDMTPFVFLSSKTTPEDLRIGMNLGADDYLIKPFSNKELIHTVATRLEKVENLKEEMKALQQSLRKRYQQLRMYSYINSHNIRGPLSNILGIIDLMSHDDELSQHPLIDKLGLAAQQLDDAIRQANEVLAAESLDSRPSSLMPTPKS